MPHFEHPNEVTVCMPTWNALLTLPRALEALCPGYQGTPCRVLTLDGASIDGTAAYVRDPKVRRHWQRRGLIDFQSLRAIDEGDVPPERKRRTDSEAIDRITRARSELARHARTPWILWVDADILIPPGGLKSLLDAARGDPSPGMIGILCDRATDHVGMGCVMMPTVLTQELAAMPWGRIGCECRWAGQQCRERGLTVGYLQGWQGRHLRHEMAGMGYAGGLHAGQKPRTVIVRGSEAARAAIVALGLPAPALFDPQGPERGATPGGFEGGRRRRRPGRSSRS